MGYSRLAKMIPAAIRKTYIAVPLICLSVSFAQSPPSKILYVGAINPGHDAKALADRYSRFGIERNTRGILRRTRHRRWPVFLWHPS